MKVEGVSIGEISYHLFPQLDSVYDSGTPLSRVRASSVVFTTSDQSAAARDARASPANRCYAPISVASTSGNVQNAEGPVADPSSLHSRIRSTSLSVNSSFVRS